MRKSVNLQFFNQFFDSEFTFLRTLPDELTQIVKDEMDRNTNLSKDLQRLRYATNSMATVQSAKGNENVSVLSMALWCLLITTFTILL